MKTDAPQGTREGGASQALWYVVQQPDGPYEIVESAESPKTHHSGGTYTMRSVGYASLEDLHAGAGMVDRCRECESLIYTSFMEATKQVLINEQLCFQCHHWTRLLPERQNRVIVGGRHYMIEPELPPRDRSLGGFGGQQWKIRFKDGREVVTTNLWHQGPIPERFRERLPDNAEFVK